MVIVKIFFLTVNVLLLLAWDVVCWTQSWVVGTIGLVCAVAYLVCFRLSGSFAISRRDRYRSTEFGFDGYEI